MTTIVEEKPINIKPLLDVFTMREGNFNLSIWTDDGEHSVALFMSIFFEIKNFLRDNNIATLLPNVEINSDDMPNVLVKNVDNLYKVLPKILDIAFKYAPEIIIEHPLSFDYWVFDKELNKVYFYDFSDDETYGTLA